MKINKKTVLISAGVLVAFAAAPALAEEQSATAPAEVPVTQAVEQPVTEAQPVIETTEQVIASENVVTEAPAAEAQIQEQPVTEAPVTQAAEQPAAETTESTQAESGEVGTVDEIDITTGKTDNTIKTWDTAKGSIKFNVDEAVKDGDKTTIQLPTEISLTRIPSQDIELKTDNDVHFASAHFDNQLNQITVNYNANAEGLQNIEGGFDFYYKLNLDVVKEVKDIELAFVVNNKQRISHKLSYVGIGEKTSPTFEKTSWQDGDDGTKIKTSIAIGKDGNGYNNMTIEDDIAANSEDNATYDYGTFKVRVGRWAWSDMYGWTFEDAQDITAEITWLDKQAGQFKIAIPESYNGRQINITYSLTYSSPVDPDETIDNKAILRSGDKQVSEWASYASIYNLSGWINGNKPVVPVVPEEPDKPVTPPEEPEKPEVPTKPTVDKPEIPTKPTEEKPKIPSNPKKHETVPVVKVSKKTEHNNVIKKAVTAEAKQYATSNYQAKLPAAGDESDSRTLVLGLVIAGVAVAAVWYERKK